MNPAISESLLLSKHLRNRFPSDPAWIQELDMRFQKAGYLKPEGDPFFTGPDDLAYYAFHVARTQDAELIPFQEAINMALHWGTGGVIYPGVNVQEWIYSPGDLVSLATVGTSAFQWSAAWGEDPHLEDYSEGMGVKIGKPGPEFFPPLAARCLERVLRKVYASEPSLQGRQPAIAVIRPDTRTRPEQASEITLNAFESDFSTSDRAEGFKVLTGRFLPIHLSRRMLTFKSEFLPRDKYFPLIDLIKEGGLDPVPDSEE